MSKQASLASFFGGPKAAPKKKSESTSKKSDGKKTSKKDVLIDTDDEVEEIIVPATKAKAPPKATPKAKATITAEKKNAASVLTTTETATRSKKKKLPDATVKEVEESKGKKGTKNARPKRQKILEDSSDEEMEVDVNNVDSVEDEDEDEDEDEPMVHKKKEIHEDEDEGNADDDNYNQEQDDDEEEDDEHDEEHDEEDEGSDEEEEGSEEDEPLKALKDKPKAKVKPNAFDKLKQAPSAKSTTSSSSSKPNKTSSAASLLSSTEEIEANTSWKKGTPALYSTLCQTLGEIEAISSRLEIQKQLTNLFRLTFLKNPTDLLTLVYLASNSVAAAYECVELGIGDSLLIKAIGEASGSQAKMIKLKYETDGDLGVVAMTAKGKQRTLGFGIKPKPLSAFEVLEVFRQIATTTGSQSQKWKINKIKGLLVRVQDPTESKYIVRGLQGKLRIGLAQSTVLTSLAHAVLLSGPVKEEEVEDEKEEDETQLSTDAKNVKNEKMPLETRLEAAVNIIKKAYSEVSSFDALVDALLKAPISQLNKTCTLRPGMPVEPMLAKPTKSIQEVLKRLNGKRFTCEFKYDGERAQVHMDEKGVTKVFSRSLLDTSEKYPEVPLYVKEACEDVTSFVLDTEVVAYNRETNQFVPFQVLSTRKKTEESEENAKVKVIVQAFDLMYLNGESLLDHTLSERRDLMKKHFKAVDGKFQFAKALDHTEDGDTTMLETFLETAVKGQCEGLMVKTLDENATYQPSYRSLNWLKLKKDYLEGMGDSVDLVPIGAYHGRGKRTGVYGAYLLACYDLDTEEFQSVCKIGTGFSDEDLKNLSKGLNDKIIKQKSSQYNVSSSLECDVWFEAVQVWEVKAADLSKSSTHKGAVDKTGETGRGIGLRFPRFERMRDDKRPDQATSSDQILDMYYAQDSIVDGARGNGGDGI